MEARHQAIAKIALAAAGEHSLALAGGYAVRAHGMGTRRSGDVDLFTDWRPVLHPDDAVANKMCALFGRALPRDFLDIDAAIVSGRYSRDHLLHLAANADGGFDLKLFADALGALTQITDDAFMQYEVPVDEITDMRHRFSQWRDELSAK